MANDGKIYIIVTDKNPTGGDTPITPGVVESKKEKQSDEDIFKHWAKNKLIETVKSTANNAIHFTLANIGNFTGDYNRQREINNSLAALNEMMNLGGAILSGAKFGPWGIALTTGAYLIGKGANVAEYFINLDIHKRATEYSIEQIRNRSGLNSHMNWNRGTEN